MTRLYFLLVVAAITSLAEASVERVEIVSRADVLQGKAFGDAGAYEKLIGKVHFAVKPEAAANKLIVDLDKAPRNAAGEVEFSADFYVLRPKDAVRSNGSVLLEVPNRGGKSILAIMQGGKGSRDPTTEEEIGDGFLMRRGVTVAWLGWQWDVREEADMMRLHAPVARARDSVQMPASKKTSNRARGKRRDIAETRVADPEGQSITGLVRADFTVNEKQDEHPLGHLISGNIGGTSTPAPIRMIPANVLTVRDAPMAERHVIPRAEWQFVPADVKPGARPELRAIRLNGGFQPGNIYEVVYRAQRPGDRGPRIRRGPGFCVVSEDGKEPSGSSDEACARGWHLAERPISEALAVRRFQRR